MSNGDGLPMGWQCSTIGETCSLISGYGFPERLQGKTDGDIPFFKVGDISEAWKDGQTYLVTARHYISQDEAASIRAKPLPPAAIVFAKIGAAISLNRRAILGQPSLVDNNVMGIWAAQDFVDTKYLFHYACTLRFGDSSRASIVPSIRKSDVERIRLPLPPRAEQCRIVAKIEELFSDLDAGVASLERAKAKLKRYRAAVLKAAVEGKLTEEWRAKHPPKETASQLLERILKERHRKWEEDQLAAYAKAGKKPLANWREKYKEPAPPDASDLPELPEGWCWATLEQVNLAERPMSYGVLQPGDDLAEGVPLVRVCDVADGTVAVDQLKRINPAISQCYKRTILKGGEILLTIVGTIGRTAVAPECLRGANTARAVAVIPVSSLISPHYVEVVLREGGMRSRLTLAAHEVARKTLNLEDVRVACIPLAPLNEQSQIITEVERLFSLAQESESQIKANLKRSSRLRQSILKRAFEGKLVPQDPKDEPASVLLERMREDRRSDCDHRATRSISGRTKKHTKESAR